LRGQGRDRPLVLTTWKTISDVGGPIVYARGALFLDALRRTLGEDAFWSAVRDYTRAGARTGSVDSGDLRRAMERASGRDLGSLFDRWLSSLAPEEDAAPSGAHLIPRAGPARDRRASP
jgi:aminopeptidase N